MHGKSWMVGASSRPVTSPRSIEPDKVALAIVELRHRCSPEHLQEYGKPRAGLSRLADLQPAEPMVR